MICCGRYSVVHVIDMYRGKRQTDRRTHRQTDDLLWEAYRSTCYRYVLRKETDGQTDRQTDRQTDDLLWEIWLIE